MKKLFYLFLVLYAVFLVITIDVSYLDADQSSHAMTGVFFNRLFSDWSSNPTVDPGNLYDYVLSYYARYPKFVFQYGPVYPLINSLVYYQFFMKLVTVFFSVMTVFLIYFIIRDLFNEEVGLLASIITATSSIFIDYSRVIMPNIVSVFFFTLGLFFYLKRRKVKIHYILSGLFFGLSVLTKEFALVYVGIISLLSLRDLRKSFKLNFIFFIVLFLTLLPYIILLVVTGGIDVLLSYPAKQAWYGAQNQDPQWYQLGGWLYFWQSLIGNYSIIGLPLLLIGLFYSVKKNRKLFFYVTLLAYLAITFVSDKAPQRILYGVVFFSGLIAYGIHVVFQRLSGYFSKSTFIFLIILMMVLSLTLVEQRFKVPMSVVASDLVSSCPNCTIFIASEVGSVYSSFLMYESLILDESASLRFIRPTVLESKSALDVIHSELVNRVVVIGDSGFLHNNSENEDYLPHINFIVNRYNLVRVYDSDIVGRIFVYDTGITEVNQSPFCSTSISMGKDFCAKYLNPVDALKA